ncbi:unnamed protein product [Prunus armeniaca]
MAMPNYAMSCFKLPVSLCKRIDKDIARYWWHSNKEQKGIHWVSWQRLSSLKYVGGLGFCDLHPESLLAHVLHDNCGRGSFWGWKGIIQGRKVLEAGLRWRIGNWKIVRISEDGWLPKPYAFKVLSRHPDMPHRVMDLIDPEVRIWQRDLIQRYFTLEEAQLILPMVISWWGCPDRQIWHFIKHGRYTVKSGYDLAIKLRRNGVIS